MELEETGAKVKRNLYRYNGWRTIEPTVVMCIKAPRGICQIYNNTPQAGKAIKMFVEEHRND